MTNGRMDTFDLAQSFVERTAGRVPSPVLAAAFQHALERLGFRYFACCSHVDPLRPPRGAVILHNYPGGWAREFCERKLHEIDPVLLHAERMLLPFSWDAPLFQARISPPQREILAQASGVGLVRGYTIPIHLPWIRDALRASCSVVPDTGPIDSRNYLVIQFMAMHLYDAASSETERHPPASPENMLSKRERQCLELAAQGKSNWTMGQILHISEHTVHRHIESAKRRLGVATRVQAILRALRGHQISFGDAIRADPPSSHIRRGRCSRRFTAGAT